MTNHNNRPAVAISSQGGVAVVTIDNPPVNAASHAVRQGLIDALAQTEADPEIRAVVLICAGGTFVAGADVREFGQAPRAPYLPDVISAVETATKPWIAALHGTALGGGLEIAMGCHYRIADAAARLGLPEVTLGLIPGAGGTVRLPRLVGPDAALSMIATGKLVPTAGAHEMGLVDAIAQTDLRNAALKYAADKADVPLPTPISQRPMPVFDREALSHQMTAIKSKARGQNSPIAACEALENAITLSAADALAAERALFLRLKDDPQSLALRHIFFAERATGKIPAIADERPPDLKTVGVIGGGTMGAGIAAACLLSGLSVTMIERDADTLSAGRSRVVDILSGSLKRGLISAQSHTAFQAAFRGGTDYATLADADLVIEAVFENLEAKQAVFAALDNSTRPDAILASNTSYLDIAQIAKAVRNPSRVIGLHFFSPAHIMKLLELVIPDGASPRSVAMGVAVGKRLRKITVPAGVCDGFIGNRVMSAYRRRCEYMIEDGALPSDVDTAMRKFGFAMGIFEMQDLAGNDISWAMRKRQASTRDPATRYVDIADKLCELGRFGRKSGRGWYFYQDGKRHDDPDIAALILSESNRKGIVRRHFHEDEIITEILAAMQAEGQKILDEGIAAQSSDIDVVMVNGYGFPRWHGGPMYLQSR
jgi:3-hydroxyacyl-CoA dehydrogenase